MKKIFLVTILAIFGLQAQAAGQFDELALLGGWELESFKGTYLNFQIPYSEGFSPATSKYLYFGEINSDAAKNGDLRLPGITAKRIDTPSCNGAFYIEESHADLTYGYYWLSADGKCINDYFISDGNKLHIEVDSDGDGFHLGLRFVIESLTDTEMRLRGFDGKCEVVYKRIGATGANSIAADDQKENSTFYTLSGVSTPEPKHGIYVEKRGAQAKKVVKP